MALIQRMVVEWRGFVGAPGFSVFHAQNEVFEGDSDQIFYDAVWLFFNSISSYLPSIVDLSFPPEIEIVEDTTGELQAVNSVTAAADISSLASGEYSAPVGAVVNWNTATIRSGRRLRGRSFIVPLVSNAYASNGQVSSTFRNILQDAADAYIATANHIPVIYGRPTALGTDGVAGQVTGARVPTLAAVLRSRRD